MIKNYLFLRLLSLFVLLFGVSVGAQTTISSQLFNNSTTDWNAGTGALNAGLTAYQLDQNEILRSVVFDFSTYETVSVEFAFFASGYGDTSDYFTVYIEDEGVTTSLGQMTSTIDFASSNSNRATYFIPSSAYTFDGDERIRIVATTNNAPGADFLLIGEIFVTGFTGARTAFGCQDFQTDASVWNQGGTPGTREAFNVNGSSHSLKLDASEFAQTADQDFSTYNAVDLVFTFKTVSFETSGSVDDVLVYFNDGGTDYLLKDLDVSLYFGNGSDGAGLRYAITTTVLASGYTFDGDEYFKIVNSANHSSDVLYIDDICMYGHAAPIPEIAVSGNAINITDGDTTPSTADHTDFGSADYISGSVTRTFTIANSGSVALNLTGTPLVAISGADAAHFSVTVDPATPVAASGTTTFQVTYNPSAAGTHNATLTIANDDSNEGTFDFAITGVGTDPYEETIHCQTFEAPIVAGDDSNWGWALGMSGTGGGANIKLDETSQVIGANSMRLKGIGTDVPSSFYSFSAYSSVTLSFTFDVDPGFTGSGEQISVQITDDGGLLWPTIATYTEGVDFFVGADNTASVTVTTASGYDFSDGINDAFQITNGSSGGNVFLYLDDICIKGITSCFDDIACADPTTTWNGTAWSAGAPTTSTPAVINGDYDTASNGNFTCCSLTVNATRTLTIASGNLVEVQSDITNDGAIAIANSGSLVQYYDLATNSGTGTLTVTRDSQPMLQYDYTYWASPVSGFDLGGLNHTRAYYWGTTNWVRQDTGNMVPGRGYIARTNNTSNTVSAATTVNFVGTLNNGFVNFAVDSATNTDDLVGNPYPSALDADAFISKNAIDQTLINGTLYFWTHNTQISGWANGVGTFTSNDYAAYNMTAGVAAGTGGAIPNGMIASGQGFFVETIGTGNIVFNNCMRSPVAADNAQFFKSSNTQKSAASKHRFWLDIINKSGYSKQMVVGYDGNATLGFDYLYDGKVFEATPVMIYSFVNDDLNDDKLAIQGRPFPVIADEVIPIGVEIIDGMDPLNRIELPNTFEGVFVNTDIFLEDKLLNVVHNLKTGYYEFTASPGVYKDRFVIKFHSVELSTLDIDEVEQEVVVAISKNKNNTLTVSSDYYMIKEVSVSSILGQTLFSGKYDGTSREVKMDDIVASSNILIVKTVLANGKEVIKKVVF